MAVLSTPSRCSYAIMWFVTQVITAAAPTNEWNSATICGKSVTSIRFAIMAPMVPPGKDAKSDENNKDKQIITKIQMTIQKYKKAQIVRIRKYKERRKIVTVIMIVTLRIIYDWCEFFCSSLGISWRIEKR